MKELVVIRKENVYVNSLVLAEAAGIEHKSLIRSVLRHKEDVCENGKFLISDFKSPLKKGKPLKVYWFLEWQVHLIVSWLRNRPQALKLKKELNNQFRKMREELQERRMLMSQYRIERKSMTDAIKELPDSPHKHFKYKHYTDLVYQAVTGMTAKTLKASRGCKKDDTPQEFLTAQEIKMITYLETQVAVLIDSGLEFEQIKEIVNKKLKQKLLKVAN